MPMTILYPLHSNIYKMSITDSLDIIISIVYPNIDNEEDRDEEYIIETLSSNEEVLNTYEKNGWVISSINFKFLFEVVFATLILLFQQ